MTPSSPDSAGRAKYAVFGNPIAHSKSPRIHAMFAESLGQQIDYDKRLAPVAGFAEALKQFHDEGGVGANITVPFKREAFAIASVASLRSQQAGAANFLMWHGDHWYCDNTDGAGLLRDVEVNQGTPLPGARVLLLGAGGAARGVLGPLLLRGPQAVVLCNRTHERAAELAATYAANYPVTAATAGELTHGPARFDIVINATSSSLSGELPLPESAKVFADGALAYDMMYGKEPTIFMKWAGAHGAARVSDGLGMLVEQAAESYAQWRGSLPPAAPVIARLRAELASE